MAVIAVPRALREKLGEEATDALVALINEAGEYNKQSVIEVVEERFGRRLSEEISKVREDIGKLRGELVTEVSKLREELSAETGKLRGELATEISKLRGELVTEVSKLREELSAKAGELRGELVTEVSKLREELSAETGKLRGELATEISKLRGELTAEAGKLRIDMHDLRANLVQWMFLFWIGQIGVLTGILFAFFRQ
jgi:Skp family chaperone for outer membrane proteins